MYKALSQTNFTMVYKNRFLRLGNIYWRGNNRSPGKRDDLSLVTTKRLPSKGRERCKQSVLKTRPLGDSVCALVRPSSGQQNSHHGNIS